MSVQLTCKQCGKQVRANDKYAGWRVECPQCKTMNQFPAKAEPLPEASEIPSRREPLPEGSQSPPRSERLPRASEIPARKEPVQSASPLPQVCSLCGKGFASQGQQVKDPQGKLFHRACYELEQRRLQGLKRCALCDRPATVEEMVQDPAGKSYHRRCYDRERARRLAQTARQGPAPTVAPLSEPLTPEPIEPEIVEPEIVEPIIIKQPSKNVVDEILKAQKQVTGREITLSEFEVEEIIIKRRIKKREIRIKSS